MSTIDRPSGKSRAQLTDFVHKKAPSGNLAPPYYLRDSDKLYVAATIDPSRVTPFLPAGVRLAPSNTAILSVYRIADTPFGPYGGAVLGVAVEGHDSIDGMEAVYWLGGYVSAIGDYLRRDYEANHERGEGKIWREGDFVFGEAARSDGTGKVSFRVRLNGNSESLYDGAYNYLGSDGRGGARIFSLVGYARDALFGELEAFEIADDASPAIRALAPVNLSWGIYLWHIDMVFGAPHPLQHANHHVAPDARRGSLLALFDHHRHPALVVAGDGTVRFVNSAAARAGVGLHPGDLLRLGTRTEQATLAASITAVANGAAVADAVALSESGQMPRTIAQVIALDPMVAGEGGVLVLLMTPAAPQQHDPSALLRLLGLTPAEARLAAAVGAGVSPRQAAQRLEIGEGTARTTIKLVFDKLGIGRQSELARIVARLELL